MNNGENYDDVINRLSSEIKCIVNKVYENNSVFDRDDLYQEVLLHLWFDFTEGRLTDKTDSYILQGCYFHLKNYIRKNRRKINFISIECIKGRDDKLSDIQISEEYSKDIDYEFFIEHMQSNNKLNSRELKILYLLLDGLSVREIGEKLGISHVMVIKIKHRVETKIRAYFRDKGLPL